MAEFTFLPPLDSPFPYSARLPEMNVATRTLMKRHALKFAPELSMLAAMVYPNLNLPALSLANHVHIFLWVVDDFVDDVDVELKDKMQLLDYCRIVTRHHHSQENNDIACHDRGDGDQDQISGKNANKLRWFHYSRDDANVSDLSYGLRVAHVWDEILTEFANQDRLVLCQYMCRQVLDYLDGVQAHLELKPDQSLTVQEYEAIRLRDGACEVVWPLCFLDKSSFEPIRDFLDSTEGKRARLAATRNVSYVNDLLSYERDVSSGEHYNVICCYRYEHQASQDEALQAITTLCNEEFDLLKSIEHSKDPTCRLVISRLLHWSIGSAYWHHTSKRYRAISKNKNDGLQTEPLLTQVYALCRRAGPSVQRDMKLEVNLSGEDLDRFNSASFRDQWWDIYRFLWH